LKVYFPLGLLFACLYPYDLRYGDVLGVWVIHGIEPYLYDYAPLSNFFLYDLLVLRLYL
jgi:hypothetical protein